MPAARLAADAGAPALHLYDRVGSTMDVAHALAAEGAAHGSVVLADVQTGGRGRAGRTWASTAGTGVWLTMVARPRDPDALDVLSLRVGLALAAALDPVAPEPVAIKWPNDLLVGGRKLAGVLIEARWRDARLDWAAVGVGVNVRPPVGFPHAAALGAAATRPDVAARVARAVRDAADATGRLRAGELEALAARDAVRGRRVLDPLAGVAAGITADGLLRVVAPDGSVHVLRQATVTYAAEDAPELP